MKPDKSNHRQILELQIENKLSAATNTLKESNKAELERIANEKHEPKFRRLRNSTALIISLLILSNLYAYLGVKQRVVNEADRVINQKLIEPQLTTTLDNAISNRSVPFIVERLKPLEATVSTLAAKTENLKRTNDTLTQSYADLVTQQIALRPRTITPEIRQSIIQSLTNITDLDVEVVVFRNDGEGMAFARQLSEVFKESGIRTAFNPVIVFRATELVPDWDGTGILLSTKDPAHPPRSAVRVHSSLKASFKSVIGFVAHSGYTDSSLGVFIGTKP